MLIYIFLLETVVMYSLKLKVVYICIKLLYIPKWILVGT